MKIIEALKKRKDLFKKLEDLRAKISKHCVDLDHEVPVYGGVSEQTEQVRGWLQACEDIVKQISDLSTAISRTNVNHKVTIELGNIQVTKTITEWILRRRMLAALDLATWDALSDGRLPAIANVKGTNGETREVKLRRYFDPKLRDTKRELYRSEPAAIDATLEIVNATTDLI